MAPKNRYSKLNPLKRPKSRVRNEEGSVIVEIAVALPMLLLLFTGVLSFAAAYNNQLTLTQAVGAGGQLLQQLRSTTSDPCKDTLTAIENSAPSLNPSNISLTLTLNGNKVTGSSCSGDQSYLMEGAPVTVSATYPCVLQAYGLKLSSSCQLSAQVTEYEY
ncbi:MAG: TadE/TadG family type IV pilus assembly protein [Terracidiphilus sp.]